MWAVVLGGAALVIAAMAFGARKVGLLRTAALGVGLAEKGRWGDRAPSTLRVDEYLAGVQPKKLAVELVELNTDSNRVNFCAAAVGWTEARTGLSNLPPWRSVAKQLMADSKAGLRGPWHPKSELESGWRPPIGALAIYHRGDPSSYKGHVDRVVAVHEDGYDALGANERGRRWTIDRTPWSSPALIGFIVDGEKPQLEPMGEGDLSLSLRAEPPAGFVEPELTVEERAFIRSAA